MAIIKAFTDIEQSKKLAGILPLGSADMRYQLRYDSKNNLKYIPRFVSTIISLKADIPCWSLAALLDVLPRVDIEKEICSDDTYDYRVKAYIGDGYIGDWYNNPIDACYEVIIKLYEVKLI